MPPNAINATLYDKLNFNFIRDIAPVASIVRGPYVMVVNPSVPAKTVPEFIAYAKANPGKINMASSGNGASTHVFGELFKTMTGINWSTCRIAAVTVFPICSADKSQVVFGTTAIVHRAHPCRQAPRSCGDDGDALDGTAGHPDRG